MNDKTDVPEIPPEILARKPMALTRETADLVGVNNCVEDIVIGGVKAVSESEKHESKLAREQAERFTGGTPLIGLSDTEISAIKGKGYSDAPAMSPMLGDRTESFVNWLWRNHPKDARVRYAYRSIFPTVRFMPDGVLATSVVQPSAHAAVLAPEVPRRRGRPRKIEASNVTTN